MSSPIEFDYDEYIKTNNAERDARWPHTKVTIPGERLWARQIGPTLVMLDNRPLDKNYRYCDIVKVDARGNVLEVVKRTFPVHLGFRWAAAEDDTADVELRRVLAERVKLLESRAVISFFWKGMGFILLRGEADVPVLLKALTEPESSLTELVHLTTVDVEQDVKHLYTKNKEEEEGA